ncbi:hypothetical protein [Cryobacterium sp. Sr3]|uniref:hypothetical protein n=1 Tax=Cryobacterium sp. Sr3 TaxID=1259194 RepID=UPI00141BF508|nr:hypothetical protein [Cryobacterium sp. Sr3]
MRRTSLTRADDDLHRQFSVKRVHGLKTPEEEVSNLLHSSLQIGDEVVLSARFGDVVPEFTGRPVVLASAGIGVTPMAGMLSHLVMTGSQRKVAFLHAGNSANTFALRNQIRADLANFPTHP